MMALSVMCVLFANTAIGNAQQRTKIADGYYLVNYGGTQVIEDDNRQMCVEVKVQKAVKDSYGQQLYNVMCKNQLVKDVAKEGLSAAIKSALTAAGVPIPGWVIGRAVSYIYDAVCNYYGE